jgi:hypothetical protein
MAFVQAAIVAAFAFVLLGSMGLFRKGSKPSSSAATTRRASVKSAKSAKSVKSVSTRSLKT